MANIKTILLSGVLISICTLSGFSQEDSLFQSAEIKQVDVLKVGKKTGLVPLSISNQTSNTFDSLKANVITESRETLKEASEELNKKKAVYPGSITVMDTRDSLEFQIIPADDEVIAERIKGLENVMPMPYNKHVKKYVDYFLYKRPNFVKQMLERKEEYFPIFEEYLAKHNIPAEMKYLALLESGLNPKAVSRVRAIGMWQFMTPTGKEYGLRINNYLDERMDVAKSTDASFRYMNWLYKYLKGDWELVLAAYNSGPGRVRRAIRRSGQTDYWKLHNYIPRDTRAYVPQWAALNYLMNFSAEHGIFPDYDKVNYPVATETLLLNGPLNLAAFAELNYMELENLKKLNPHLLKDDIPSYARNLEVNIPVDTYSYFEENKDCILDLAAVLSDPSDNIASLTDAKGTYHIERKSVKKYYRVRSGDYLGKIASRQGVRVSDLKRWNNLRSSTIRTGQRLTFYKKQSVKIYDSLIADEEKAAALIAASSSNKDTTSGAEASNVKVANTEVPATKNTEELNAETDTASSAFSLVSKTVKRYHFIRSGENLTTIARKRGTSIAKLKQWNSLKSSNKILKGQRLVYYITVTEKIYSEEPESVSGQFIVHTVQKGDTLWSISRRYGFSISELKKLNGISSNTVKIGQKIKVKA